MKNVLFIMALSLVLLCFASSRIYSYDCSSLCNASWINASGIKYYGLCAVTYNYRHRECPAFGLREVEVASFSVNSYCGTIISSMKLALEDALANSKVDFGITSSGNYTFVVKEPLCWYSSGNFYYQCPDNNSCYSSTFTITYNSNPSAYWLRNQSHSTYVSNCSEITNYNCSIELCSSQILPNDFVFFNESTAPLCDDQCFWKLWGNSGTTISNFVGTKDDKDLVFKTNAVNDNYANMRIKTDGTIQIGRETDDLPGKNCKVEINCGSWNEMKDKFSFYETTSSCSTKAAVFKISQVTGTSYTDFINGTVSWGIENKIDPVSGGLNRFNIFYGPGFAQPNRANFFTITENGNVGIGDFVSNPFSPCIQPDPSAKLDVAGNARIRVMTNTGGINTVTCDNAGNLHTHDGIPLFGNDAWSTNGNTGLTSSNCIGTLTVAPLKFKTSPTNGNTLERMIIDESGNIGLNTYNTFANPTARLQVHNGFVMFDGDLDDNGNTIPSGTDNRFMWIPEKGSVISGGLDIVHAPWLSNWSNFNNTSTLPVGPFSTILGLSNYATGDNSFVTGHNNQVSGYNSTVLGYDNKVNLSDHSSIIKGCYILGESNTFNNIRSSDGSCIIGFVNRISNSNTTYDGNFIFGGGNIIENAAFDYAIGNSNTLTLFNSISIGNFNKVLAAHAMTLGNNVTIENNGRGSCIIGDLSYNAGFTQYIKTSSTSLNQMTMRFLGHPNNPHDICYRLISGLDFNTSPETELGLFLSKENSIGTGKTSLDGINNVALGANISISADYSSGFGSNLTISSNTSVAMGSNVTVNYSNNGSFIFGDATTGLGGYTNITTAPNQMTMRFTGGDEYSSEPCYRFISGIYNNTTNELGLFILKNNSVKGGLCDVQSGNSFAFGADANINSSAAGSIALGSGVTINSGDNGSFAFGDASGNMTYSSAANQITMRFTADMTSNTKSYDFFYGGTYNSNICEAYLKPYSPGWFTPSDSNLKEDKKIVNYESTLKNLLNINIYNWKFKGDSNNNRWVSPMAQDFYNTYRLGPPDSCFLNSSLIDGIALACIHALANRTDTLRTEVNKLVISYDSLKCNPCDRITALEHKIDSLTLKLDSLTKKFGGNVINKDESNNLMGNTNFDDIILEQNNPNPYSENTEINYYIPSKYKSNSRLLITDENGTHIFNESVVCFGKPCQISFSAKELITGIYLYGIEINGKLTKSKKMMIIK